MAREGRLRPGGGQPAVPGHQQDGERKYVAVAHYAREGGLVRGVPGALGYELVRPGGLSAMVTMRGWMFLGQFAELRDDSY
jgi:hypothetical protein